MKSPLLIINPEYFYKILDWKTQPYELVGNVAMLPGFDRYNHLIKLNSLFSTSPIGEPVDRTQHITGPFNFGIVRPWAKPRESLTFDEVMVKRINYYLNTGEKLNLCWSGGIDSTCFLAGFLQHTTNFDQLRVLYSPFSLYENREFFEHLQKNYPNLELVDISGDVYLETTFDGILVNGHGGDEFTASLDESFFDALGADGLHKPWRSFVQDSALREFCEEYFALSGRSIDSVLEARWWFYSATKSQVFAQRWQVTWNTPTSKLSSFFDCQEFEDYMWHNTDKIISGNTYNTYKQFLKKYIYDFYPDTDYYLQTKKETSSQFIFYTRKKVTLLGQQWIAGLVDGTIIKTPNLPLLSKLEFDNKYGNSLDYLFNF